jgi:hypothetical protein
MEFYWKVRAFNVTGSGSFTDDNVGTFFDTFNGVQGNAIPGVTMRSFMCQFGRGGNPQSSSGPNPQPQSGVFGTFSGPEGGGTFECSLNPKRGFKNSGNHYIALDFFVQESISTNLGSPEPVFGLKGVVFDRPVQKFGEGDVNFRHTLLLSGGRRLGLLAWRMGSRVPEPGKPIDLAVRLSWNRWQGRKNAQAEVIDWRFSASR